MCLSIDTYSIYMINAQFKIARTQISCFLLFVHVWNIIISILNNAESFLESSINSLTGGLQRHATNVFKPQVQRLSKLIMVPSSSFSHLPIVLSKYLFTCFCFIVMLFTIFIYSLGYVFPGRPRRAQLGRSSSHFLQRASPCQP